MSDCWSCLAPDARKRLVPNHGTGFYRGQYLGTIEAIVGQLPFASLRRTYDAVVGCIHCVNSVSVHKGLATIF